MAGVSGITKQISIEVQRCNNMHSFDVFVHHVYSSSTLPNRFQRDDILRDLNFLQGSPWFCLHIHHGQLLLHLH